MIARCLNQNHKQYSDYGGRGITIHQGWLDSFEDFANYLGPKPAPGMSLDRKDNNGNYEPGNIRWATQKEQIHNRRPFKRICGEEHPKARLTAQVVLEIRQLLSTGLSQQKIANQFGIARTTVQDIKSRRLWNHLA